MEPAIHTTHLLLMEDNSTKSIVDYFKNQSYNVELHLFDNLNDIMDTLTLCSDFPRGSIHFILFFNLKHISEEIKQFIFRVKEDRALKPTPVFILSESTTDNEVMELYNNHLTNYIIKPEDSEDLKRVLDSFMRFWFDLAELP